MIKQAESPPAGRTQAAREPRPINATELGAVIEEALRQVGEQDYFAKDASEVIELAPIVERLESMNAIAVNQVLVELSQEKGRYAEPLVHALIHSLDQREDFEQIIDHPLLGPLY